MNPPYKITARNLGHLALADRCEACFAYLSKMYFHPPFNGFGAALFKDCEKMEAAMVGYYLERDGCLPEEFSPFCDVKERIAVSKNYRDFGYMHESGVWLYGEPDEVLRRRDNSGVIWDHKTAHPKNTADENSDSAKSGKKKGDLFRPMYDTQVTGYALIGEVGKELGTFSAGALCYWDIQRDAVVSDPGEFIKDGLLHTAFRPVIYEVELEYSRIDNLLEEAIKIWKSKVPPEHKTGCPDGKKLQALFAIQSEIENECAVRDRTMLAMSNNDPWVYGMIVNRLQDRATSRLADWHELREAGESLTFDEDSVAAQWEFFQ